MKETNKFFTIILLIISAFILSYDNYFYIFPFCFIISFIQHPKSYKFLLNTKFILMTSIFIGVVPLILGQKDAKFLNIEYSSFFFRTSLILLLRGILFLGAIGLLSTLINKDDLIKHLSKSKGVIPQVISIGLKALAGVTQSCSKTYYNFIHNYGKSAPFLKPVTFITMIFLNLEIFIYKFSEELSKTEKKEKKLNDKSL